MTTTPKTPKTPETPEQEPTEEDLRVEAEHTRQELADTVAALSDKADVKTRVKTAAAQRTEAIQAGGEELVDKLPDPVAERVRPMWRTVSNRPVIPLAVLAALLVALLVWLKVRKS